MHKKLQDFNEKFTGLKNVIPRTKDKKELKEKVLNDARDLFNNLYCTYKDKYSEEINSLNTENKKKLDYKKLRLTDDYQYSSEEEKEETSEKLTKTDFDELNEQIIRKETGINRKLFKEYCNSQMPTAMFKNLYNQNNENKNNELVNVIKSSLIDLKNDIENTSKDDVNKIEEMNKQQILLNLFLILIKKKKQEGKVLKILTPNQMLSRLSISLAQLNAGNNSEKL